MLNCLFLNCCIEPTEALVHTHTQKYTQTLQRAYYNPDILNIVVFFFKHLKNNNNTLSILNCGSCILVTERTIFFISVQVPEPDEPKLLDDIAVNERNADPCTSYNCLWSKYSDGKIWVPYVIANHYCTSYM